jgi:hypothetical protein
MLQWKPRLIVVLLVLVAIAALIAQLTWDGTGIDQLTW